jgi:hypothetical protein
MNEEDRILLGLMSFAYHNIQLIRDLTDHLLENPDSQVTHFYEEWCITNGLEKHFLPLNPGSIWMILTAILVTAKHQWGDIFPSIPISQIEDKWGLKNAEIECEEYTDPPLNYVIQKMRNAFAHPQIGLEVPPGIDEKIPIKILLTETYYTLKDKYKRGKYFKMRISLSDLARFSSEVFTTISNHVRGTLM